MDRSPRIPPPSPVIPIERDLYELLQWTRFESDVPALWMRVADAAHGYLLERWRAGDLLGTTAAEAFFVHCDSTTMTQRDIDLGVVVVVIGLAVNRPAEFTVIRLQLPTASNPI